jgi:hypothetical protein
MCDSLSLLLGKACPLSRLIFSKESLFKVFASLRKCGVIFSPSRISDFR